MREQRLIFKFSEGPRMEADNPVSNEKIAAVREAFVASLFEAGVALFDQSKMVTANSVIITASSFDGKDIELKLTG